MTRVASTSSSDHTMDLQLSLATKSAPICEIESVAVVINEHRATHTVEEKELRRHIETTKSHEHELIERHNRHKLLQNKAYDCSIR